MNKYVYQKFLLNCDYESINLLEIPIFEGKVEDVLEYSHDYCLFDVGKEVIRKINVAEIDNLIDTEEDWDNLLKLLCGTDAVVLYNYEVTTSNPIIRRYREVTLKAYLYRLMKNKYRKRTYRQSPFLSMFFKYLFPSSPATSIYLKLRNGFEGFFI